MSELLIDRADGGTVILTLNRPASRNAFTRGLLDDLAAALRAADADPTARAVILTGAGPGFCAGVDLRNAGNQDLLGRPDPLEGRVEWSEFVTDCLLAVRRCNLPVIAAVNGVAVGGGFSLALLADIRIAGPEARFADGYIRNGLSGCELGLSYLLPRAIGSGHAMELLLTGRTVHADEAARLGLVNRVVPADELLDTARGLAREISAHSPFAVAATKQVATANSEATGLHHAMLLEMRTQMLTTATADMREARAALIERRTPEYTGYRTR